MTRTAVSKDDVPIRLTEERWSHIIEEHGELAEMQEQVLQAVANPERILAGNHGEKFAVAEIEKGKWMVTIYREDKADGFIITAFMTRRVRSLDRRNQLWP